MTVQTVIQYGIEYVPGRRPVAPFPNIEAAIDYLNDNPPQYPQPPIPTIVERIILTGDWEPVKPSERTP
jgi:hypothetical protein